MAYLPTEHHPSNDYHVLPATEKQIAFARRIEARSGVSLPGHALLDRRRLSHWIDENDRRRQTARFDQYASSKQVRFAEAIARRRRRDIPQECFKGKTLMSRWIDANR